MIDIDLLVKVIRDHGHTVEHIIPVPENAGEYEFVIDGRTLTLAEARMMLEAEDAKHDA